MSLAFRSASKVDLFKYEYELLIYGLFVIENIVMAMLIDNWWFWHLFYWYIYEVINDNLVAAAKVSHLNGHHLIFSGIPVIS